MKVFIPWSRPRSNFIARQLHEWLPLVLQNVEPWMSEKSVGHGTMWVDELMQLLEKCDAGIICLTPENRDNSWLLFEAGAIAQKVRRQGKGLFVYCFGFDDSQVEVEGPLSLFQRTLASPDKPEETLRLVMSLNDLHENEHKKIPEAVAETSFQKWWPKLEKGLEQVRRAHVDREITTYFDVRDGILEFAQFARTDWTKLTGEQRAQTRRLRRRFRKIADFAHREAERKELGRIRQLLGASAFYSNNIDEAHEHFEEALEVLDEFSHEYKLSDEFDDLETLDREKQDAVVKHSIVLTRAHCHHFLGLIAKAWWLRTEMTEPSLQDAKMHLENARDLLREKKNEFLTPLTLAEVLSYIAGEQDEARKMLDKIIEELLELQKVQHLTGLLHGFLGRAFLLQGNLEFMRDNRDGARQWYVQAVNNNPQNPYAVLSVADVTSPESDDRRQGFEQGLTMLLDSKALQKPEHTTRAIALCWAALAAAELGDLKKADAHLRDLESIVMDLVQYRGEWVPSFFSPITKNLVSLNLLLFQTREEIDRRGRGDFIDDDLNGGPTG